MTSWPAACLLALLVTAAPSSSARRLDVGQAAIKCPSDLEDAINKAKGNPPPSLRQIKATCNPGTGSDQCYTACFCQAIEASGIKLAERLAAIQSLAMQEDCRKLAGEVVAMHAPDNIRKAWESKECVIKHRNTSACYRPPARNFSTRQVGIDLINSYRQLPVGPQLNSQLHSGYITLDADRGRKLFYVFGEAENDPKDKPLIFWMNGGPGCSSVGLGLFKGNGPFVPVSNSTQLLPNKYSFTTFANALWVEQPAFTGFSTSKAQSDRFSDDSKTSQGMLDFLLKFYERFPEYQKNKLFLAGQSYAGHFGPNLAKRILQHNDAIKSGKKDSQSDIIIPLSGLAMGNAWTDAYYDNKATVDFWYNNGIISRDVYDSLLKCDLSKGALWRTEGPSGFTPECEQLRDKAYKQIGEIDQYGLNAPICVGKDKKYPMADPEWHGFMMYDPCAAETLKEVMNNREVQLSLGAIQPHEQTRAWTGCVGKNLSYSVPDMVASMVPTYKMLVARGLPIMVSSGETDAYVPLAGTRAWMESLNLPLLNATVPIRQWKDTHTEQIGGSVVEYKGLTRVSVRFAGHSLSAWQPRKNVQLMKAFVNSQKLPNFEHTH